MERDIQADVIIFFRTGQPTSRFLGTIMLTEIRNWDFIFGTLNFQNEVICVVAGFCGLRWMFDERSFQSMVANC